MSSLFLTGLLLSFLAGISTTIGGAIAFLIKKPTSRILSFTLGFSAGTMISISFLELLGKAIEEVGFLYSSIAFFIGIILFFIIDVLAPHEYIAEKIAVKNYPLMKMGVFTALGIAIHNFPEGFVVFAGSLYSIKMGILLAVAVAIHNIPEGISVSIPIFYATSDKRKALFYSFLSGISEPVGALIAASILLPFLSPNLISFALAFAAGIMVYISLDELLPAAHEYGEEHVAMSGVILGMLIMATTLIMLR